MEQQQQPSLTVKGDCADVVPPQALTDPFHFNTARVVSYSKMVHPDTGAEMSLTDQVVYCARVSNPENQWNMDTSERLVAYLLRNKHFSPFEMVNICVEIETTRDISHQIIRHRSFSFQEFSQRYAAVQNFTARECRLQHAKNRQMSVDVDGVSTESQQAVNAFHCMQDELITLEGKYYKECLDMGIAREQARVLLSEGLTCTRLYMNGTLRSWIHYLQSRANKNTTQREHYDLACKIMKVIEPLFPQIVSVVEAGV